jgi:O-antigen/teichoic acid export membrane protein
MIRRVIGIKQKYGKSKEVKVLAENFLSLSALKLVGYVFPLINLPYLARVIGVDKFGEIAFAFSIIIYFQTLVDFGFNYTAVRDIARTRDNIQSVSRIFSTIMATRVLLMVLSLILLLLCIYTVPVFYANRLILLLTFLYIPGYIILPEWFFQAMEDMKYITYMNLLSKLIFTILIFVVIKQKSDYIYQPILTALGYFVSGIVAIPIILRKYKIQLIMPSFKDMIKALRESWDMFVSLFLPNLYSNFSVILLKSYSGAVATGLYSSGWRFIDLVDQLALVLSRTFYPFLARRLDRHKTYVIISFAISLTAGLCLFLGADLLIKIFYTDAFAESAKVIRMMALCPFFLTLMNTYGPNYLVLAGKEHILRNIIIICSIGGFILTWVIVPTYSYMGVALTLMIVWGIRGTITWIYARRYKNLLVNSN